MCNLYSLTKGQAAIRDWFRARHDRTGNLPLFPGIFPDQMAPIVRVGPDGDRELVMARWGMPGRRNMAASQSPISATSRARIGADGSDRSIVASCPATSFCEYEDTKPRKTPIWFALAEDRPLFAFAGLWMPWRGAGDPKSAPVVGQHELVRLPDNRGQRDRRADPSQSDASHPNVARGSRSLARRANARGAQAAAAIVGRRPQDRGEGQKEDKASEAA